MIRKYNNKRPPSSKDELDLAKHTKKDRNKFFMLLTGQHKESRIETGVWGEIKPGEIKDKQ